MKKEDEQLENRRLYFIEQEPATANGEIELYRWEDANEIIEHFKQKHPEVRFIIREFMLCRSYSL
jgi:hypothetical protein